MLTILKWIAQGILIVGTFSFIYLGITDKNKKFFIFAALSGVLCIGLSCVTSIPANTVGIKYNFIFGTSEDTLSEGLVLKSPLDKVYLIDTTVQERTIENLSSQTKDSQFVTISVNVKYQVEPANAYKIYKGYKTLENLDTNLIANMAQRCIEEITTKYNIIEVLGEKRNDIYRDEVLLKERLLAEGINFKMLTIKDTDAGDEIKSAIRAEAIAKKAVETAEQNKQKAEIEAQTKLIEAEGEAAANKVKTESLTDQILVQQWIEKWNGIMPIVSGQDGTMVDISSLVDNK